MKEIAKKEEVQAEEQQIENFKETSRKNLSIKRVTN